MELSLADKELNKSTAAVLTLGRLLKRFCTCMVLEAGNLVLMHDYDNGNIHQRFAYYKDDLCKVYQKMFFTSTTLTDLGKIFRKTKTKSVLDQISLTIISDTDAKVVGALLLDDCKERKMFEDQSIIRRYPEILLVHKNPEYKWAPLPSDILSDIENKRSALIRFEDGIYAFVNRDVLRHLAKCNSVDATVFSVEDFDSESRIAIIVFRQDFDEATVYTAIAVACSSK